jgi:hypothetical protein
MLARTADRDDAAIAAGATLRGPLLRTAILRRLGRLIEQVAHSLIRSRHTALVGTNFVGTKRVRANLS